SEGAPPVALSAHGPGGRAGQEGGGHAPRALVEDPHHRRVGADRDDQPRARFVREQHRRVLARAPGDERLIVDARLDEVVASWIATIGVYVMYELGAAEHRLR